jgi:hypothetical protein
MGWIHGGSLAVWYLAFAVLSFRVLGPLHNPLILAFGHFVCLPLLLLGICGVTAQAIPATAAAIDAAMEKGFTRRR